MKGQNKLERLSPASLITVDKKPCKWQSYVTLTSEVNVINIYFDLTDEGTK
jgi:hypothetical protein